MHISGFEVENYKSFLSSRQMYFKPGFNVIVGQNNVGKTALAEALSLRFVANPHRSRKTIPFADGIPENPQSGARFTFEMSAEELREIVKRRQLPNPLYVAVSVNSDASNTASRVHGFLASGPKWNYNGKVDKYSL